MCLKEDFTKSGLNKKFPQCRKCKAEEMRRYRKKHNEKYNDKVREYHREYMEKWREEKKNIEIKVNN